LKILPSKESRDQPQGPPRFQNSTFFALGWHRDFS
jgi:hypothetical protein